MLLLATQGIYDKRQRTEHEMVHREQEIKQLQGWAQTVQNLVNKFEDGLNELGPLAAIEEVEAGLATPEEDTPPAVDEEVPSAVATARALTNRARDLTAHRQGIAKLRQHFSKVCPDAWSTLMHPCPVYQGLPQYIVSEYVWLLTPVCLA